MNIKPILKTVEHWMKKNSSKVLTSTALVAQFVGFYFMHKEAPIVRDKLDALPKDAKLTDKLKVAVPVYLPAMGMLALSSGCMVGSCVAGERKAAILSGLYTASEAALSKYEAKVVETIGKEKAQEIQDGIAQDLINEKPSTSVNVFATGKGDQLFYDPLSGRYFTSEKLAVQEAMNNANRTIIGDMWITTNEWYDELGLEPIGLGDTVGWNVDRLMDISFSTGETPDNRPCYVLDYSHSLPRICK